MKRKTHLTALLFAALLALTACSGGGENGGSDPLATAMTNMDNVASMDAKMVMEMDMEAAGQAMETVTTMDMSVFNKPMRMRADMTMSMGAYGGINMQIYAEEGEDGGLVMYMNDGTDWYKEDTTAEELTQYDVGSSLDFYMDSTTGFKQEGKEETEGVSAYKYTGVITGEAMQEVMLSSGALDSFSTSMSMDESQVKDMLSGLGDISVTLWIDEEQLYPVRYDMDMTDIMSSLMGKILENLDAGEDQTMSISKMTISMTCSNFNNATDFTIPEEAKA